MAPQDDLTAERAAAERVIRECPEVWNRVCYLSDCTFQALATRILEYGQQTRQEALREAARVAKAYIKARDDSQYMTLEEDCERWRESYRVYADAADALDRLASEGG